MLKLLELCLCLLPSKEKSFDINTQKVSYGNLEKDEKPRKIVESLKRIQK